MSRVWNGNGTQGKYGNWKDTRVSIACEGVCRVAFSLTFTIRYLSERERERDRCDNRAREPVLLISINNITETESESESPARKKNQQIPNQTNPLLLPYSILCPSTIKKAFCF